MDKHLLYISEEHIGLDASPGDAHRVIDLLQANGWTAVYGDRPWSFSDEEQRASFDKAFEWALEVVTAEKRPYAEKTWIELAKQRVRFNERLRPYEAKLIIKRPDWEGYFRWLLETPTDVILHWVETSKEDAPKD